MKMYIYVGNIVPQRFLSILFLAFFAVFPQTLYANSGVGFPGLSHVFHFSMCLRVGLSNILYSEHVWRKPVERSHVEVI